MRADYNDYICGTKFRDIAHYVLRDGSTDLIHYSDREPGQYPVLYGHTHEFATLAQHASKFNEKVVLITHNSDGGVRATNRREYDADPSLLPDNVVTWYAQNVEVPLRENLRIKPLPIGLENRYCFDYDKAKILFDFRDAPGEWLPADKLYLNCNISTNPVERGEIYNIAEQLPHVTIERGSNGQDYGHYLRQIRLHTLTLSPRGNGADCHRTWETMYLGRTPIVKKDDSNELWEYFHLPVVYVEDWGEITDLELMNNKLSWARKNAYYDALSFKFWKRVILYANP